MEFTADQVWGAAVAAHRINDGYFKEDQWNHNSASAFLAKTANKNLVKKWLRDSDFTEVTEADVIKGQEFRNHFKGYTLLAIKGQLNDFQQQALRIASKETFTGRDLLDFAIVSCLPSVADRDVVRTQLKRDIYASEQLLGEEGDAIRGEITVISCRWSPAYNKYRINARMGESFVDFWFSHELEGTLMIKAKIKAQRGDKTTQLNYVKKA